MESVQLAVLVSTPRRIRHLKNVSPLWVGHAHVAPGHEPRVYMKAIPLREILAEVVCAELGRAAGLPIPAVYLVLDREGLAGMGDNTLLFGAEDADFPSFRQVLDADMSESEALSLLRSWRHLQAAIVFDEWVVNSDRNIGNLLYDGDGEFVLIDHGRCLGAPHANLPDPGFQDPRNYLAMVARGMEQCRMLCHQVTKSVELFRQLPFEDLSGDSIHLHYASQQDIEEVLDFLQKRILRLPFLIGRYTTQCTMDV